MPRILSVFRRCSQEEKQSRRAPRAQNAKTGDSGTFDRNPLSLLAPRLCHVHARRHQATDAAALGDRDAESCRALKPQGGLTGSGHQAGCRGRIALDSGSSRPVALRELNGRSRKRAPVFVYSHAAGPPTASLALTRCPQSVTTIPPSSAALSVRSRYIRGSTATYRVGIGGLRGASQTLALSA